MTLILVPDHVDIPFGKGNRRIPGKKSLEVTKINSAQVALKGFSLSFREGENPIKAMQINLLEVSHGGNDVQYTVVCQYQDRTGNDEYNGRVETLIIADVEKPPTHT